MRTIVASALGFLILSSASAGAAAFPMTPTSPVSGSGYAYTAQSKGGTGHDTYFAVPTVPAGYYTISWIATFNPQGTVTSPVEWSCNLSKNATFVATTTSADTSTAYFAGVSGTMSMHIEAGDTVYVDCGNDIDTTWTWGPIAVQFDLVKLASRVSGKLPLAPPPGVPQRSATKLQSTLPQQR